MPVIAVFPGTVIADADWSNPNNIKVEDGSVAFSAMWGSMHGSSGTISGKNFGFTLPTNAVIDGYLVDLKFSSINLQEADISLSNAAGTKYGFRNIPQNPGSLTWYSAGGSTDLWGQTFTVAEINNSGFSVNVSGQASHAPDDAQLSIDALRLTIYYHLGLPTTPTDVPIREVYKVYNAAGVYIGNLPTPTSPLKISQDINSLGSQITVNVPVSADVIELTANLYTAEDGTTPYTDEAGVNQYSTGAQVPIVSAAFQGIDTLIKNGNIVQCWISNYWYPNGKCMFIGRIRRWEADFGGTTGSGDTVNIILYSTSYDMDNYITRGAPFSYTTDVSQTSQNATLTSTVYDYGGWLLHGQTWKVGVGVTNLGAISLLLLGTAHVTINVFDIPNGGVLLGSTTQLVSVGTATVVQFGFGSLIPVTAGTTYFFEVRVNVNESIQVYYQNSSVYADGTAYESIYGGGGGGSYSTITADMYFITASGTPSTTATFTSKDPSTQMLLPIAADYNVRGGSVRWLSANVDATGLSLTYKFNVQTVYESVQAVLSLAPDGFYYYVDLGTQLGYFKNQATTAEFLFQKGVHVNTLKLITTTESSKNTVLFTGGDTGSGSNLYKIYNDSGSIGQFGPLLDRKTDNRVTLDATANAIGLSEIAALSGEQYQTTVTIPHTTKLDITLLAPGKVVGFRGYGTFVDDILAQIVHRDWTAEYVTLTLGILPKRLIFEYENITRQLIAQQTQDNPGTPT